MSSIFSDPPFRRGTTLAEGGFGDAATSGPDILGGGIVGQIKCFQDVAHSAITYGTTANGNPPRAPGAVLSNRLVYCQAVRWKGSNVSDASTIAGCAYTVDLTLENGKPFASITTAATNADAAAGRDIGVLDEYLTGQLNTNDVVWIVRRGPCAIKQAAGTAITSGARVELTGTAGKIQALASGAALGISVLGENSPATADTLVRVNITMASGI